MNIRMLLLLGVLYCTNSLAEADSSDLEKRRRESGVDPTRVESRASYSILVQPLPENLRNQRGQILQMGVNKNF